MKRLLALLLAGMTLTAPVTYALSLSDGQSYTFSSYYKDDLVLDEFNSTASGTHANLNNGAYFQYGVKVYNYATIDINGGTLSYPGFRAYDNSVVTLQSGLIKGYSYAYQNTTFNVLGGDGGSIDTRDNSRMLMSGGTVKDLKCGMNSTVTISGGSVQQIWYSGSGIVELCGTGFEINGYALSTGDRISDFVPLVERLEGESGYLRTGTVTGVLADGSTWDCPFVQYSETLTDTADIVIIPEPATLALMTIGGLLIRNKNKNKNKKTDPGRTCDHKTGAVNGSSYFRLVSNS